MESPTAILQWIQNQKHPREILLVSIDGPGGTGKTTLAQNIQLLDSSITVVHMDHFDLPTNGQLIGGPWKKEIGADTDWRRLLSEVILPLREGMSSSYYPFDRETGRIGKREKIFPGGIVLIEGVFSMRKELFPSIDIAMWLTCSLDVRLRRALKRDGEKMRYRWEKDWIPMEERYVAEHKPQTYAHKIIDTGK